MPEGAEEQARTFFSGVLGMTEVAPPSALGHLKIVWFQAGPDGHEIHLFTDREMDMKSTGQHICLQVDDVEAYRARFAEHGVPIQDTDEIPNRPRFFVRDPFNNQIEICEINGQYT
jgi:catechol 2,3-dioxygenase-like lactoylglutathione lyase family enzyme